MAISKVIRGGEEEIRTWELPEVGSQSRGQRPGATLEELEALQKAAYEEGFAEGRAAGLEQGRVEGYKAGEQEAKALAQKIRAIYTSLAAPVAELDEQVEEQLTGMVLALAQQIIRRELTLQPGEIMGLVREAVGLLPFSSRDVKIRLHPDDARFLREAWGEESEEARAYTLVEDPSLSRGGCKVSTPTSQIDATLERRLAVLASELLGGSREADQDES